MPASTERILVSHAGALPRPDALQRLFGAGPGFQDAIAAALPGAVAEVVGRQAAAGVDIVNDGEISKRGLFTGYIRDRMTGFEAEAGGDRPPANAGVTGRDRRDFPGFFAAGFGGFDFQGAERLLPGRRVVPRRDRRRAARGVHGDHGRRAAAASR